MRGRAGEAEGTIERRPDVAVQPQRDRPRSAGRRAELPRRRSSAAGASARRGPRGRTRPSPPPAGRIRSPGSRSSRRSSRAPSNRMVSCGSHSNQAPAATAIRSTSRAGAQRAIDLLGRLGRDRRDRAGTGLDHDPTSRSPPTMPPAVLTSDGVRERILDGVGKQHAQRRALEQIGEARPALVVDAQRMRAAPSGRASRDASAGATPSIARHSRQALARVSRRRRRRPRRVRGEVARPEESRCRRTTFHARRRRVGSSASASSSRRPPIPSPLPLSPPAFAPSLARPRPIPRPRPRPGRRHGRRRRGRARRRAGPRRRACPLGLGRRCGWS